MEDKEIALRLTEMINRNMNEHADNFLNEQGVINTYKRVLEAIRDDK